MRRSALLVLLAHEPCASCDGLLTRRDPRAVDRRAGRPDGLHRTRHRRAAPSPSTAAARAPAAGIAVDGRGGPPPDPLSGDLLRARTAVAVPLLSTR